MPYEVITFQNIKLRGSWDRQAQGMADNMISYLAGARASIVIDFQKPIAVDKNQVVLISVTANVAHVEFAPPTTPPAPH